MAVEELAASHYPALTEVAHHCNHIGFEAFEEFLVAKGVAHNYAASGFFEVFLAAKIGIRYCAASGLFEVFLAAMIAAHYSAAFFDPIGEVLSGEDF
jgi:hypothetical protein